MPLRRPPECASIAHASEGGRLFSPSSARNAPALCDLLDEIAPASGSALELASGSGQHVAAFAARLPGLRWQPTEPDPARRASIDAHAAQAGLDNIAPARALDATEPGWGAEHAGRSLIVVINLLHLISTPEAQVLIREAARALAPGGRLMIYGPFMRGGELTSEGDRAFHARLSAWDDEIGYKDDFDTLDMMQDGGLEIVMVVEMPANNLALVAEKPGG